MKRIAALSFAIAAIVLTNAPVAAIPMGIFRKGADAAGDVGGKAAREAAENADAAVKGLPSELDPATGSAVIGDETPTQILRSGAEEAGLNPDDAIRGTRQPPEEVAPESSSTVPTATIVNTAERAATSDSGSGAAVPIAGGATLIVSYGIYRVIKSRL